MGVNMEPLPAAAPHDVYTYFHDVELNGWKRVETRNRTENSGQLLIDFWSSTLCMLLPNALRVAFLPRPATVPAKLRAARHPRRFPDMLLYDACSKIKTKIGGLMSRLYGTDENRSFTVAIEGNIGSGKTTLLQYFEDSPNVEVIQEPVKKWRNIDGHNALKLLYEDQSRWALTFQLLSQLTRTEALLYKQGLMYEDPTRWSLTFQTYVQLTMLQTHVQKQKAPVKLMERSLYSAKYCFAENLHKSGKMPDIEHIILSRWFDWILQNHDCHLDLIVYLRTDPQTVYERIKKRCRQEENNIPMEYLQRLHNLHEDWLMEQKFPLPAPVLLLDGNEDHPQIIDVYEEKRADILGGYS